MKPLFAPRHSQLRRRKLFLFVTRTSPLADISARCYIDESPWHRYGLQRGKFSGSAVRPRFSQIRLTARPRLCSGSTETIDPPSSVGIYFSSTRGNEVDASEALPFRPFTFIRTGRSGLWIRKFEFQRSAGAISKNS